MQNFDVSSLINIPVVGICFVVGYLIKNSIPKIPNKCIEQVFNMRSIACYSYVSISTDYLLTIK